MGAGRPDAKPMEVVRYVTVSHIERRVLLTTTDGLEAEAFVHDLSVRDRAYDPPRIEGVHMTHGPQDEQGRCSACATPLDNGCFASHMPCGRKSGKAIITQIEEWKAAHE